MAALIFKIHRKTPMIQDFFFIIIYLYGPWDWELVFVEVCVSRIVRIGISTSATVAKSTFVFFRCSTEVINEVFPTISYLNVDCPTTTGTVPSEADLSCYFTLCHWRMQPVQPARGICSTAVLRNTRRGHFVSCISEKSKPTRAKRFVTSTRTSASCYFPVCSGQGLVASALWKKKRSIDPVTGKKSLLDRLFKREISRTCLWLNHVYYRAVFDVISRSEILIWSFSYKLYLLATGWNIH